MGRADVDIGHIGLFAREDLAVFGCYSIDRYVRICNATERSDNSFWDGVEGR